MTRDPAGALRYATWLKNMRLTAAQRFRLPALHPPQYLMPLVESAVVTDITQEAHRFIEFHNVSLFCF